MPSIFRRRAEAAPTIVASAAPVNVANFEETQALTLSRQAWQLRAYGYYDDVGEIHFPANYVGNALSRIRLVAAEEPASPSDAPAETKNDAVKLAVKNLRAPMGGQGALLKAMGINVFLAGECFLIGSDVDGVQSWEAVSINELEIRAGQKVPLRRRNPVETPQPLPADTLVVRVWRAHPRYSGLADSAMRNVLDECEKLLLLTRADKAAARSRIAGNGMLYIPNEIMPPSQQPSDGSGNGVDAGDNPIYQNLVDSMITPIRDEQHPSGIVPVTIFGPAEYGDKIKYITFDRPQAARAIQQREESIQRIAIALDLPSEILTGKADLNHWTAWQVHEETFQAHLQPFVELLCDALTVGYLRPALKRAGVTDAEKYVIWYDDSDLVVRPDKGQTALQLHEANVISGEALRRETGFAEEDAMGEDEYNKHVGLVLQDEQLALTGKPSANQPTSPEAPPTLQDATKLPPVAPGKVGGDRPTLKDKLTPPPKRLPTAGDQTKTPAEKAVTASAGRPRRQTPIGVQLAQLDVELMTQLRTAASEVLVRELDRAGARIRSKSQGDQPTKQLLENVPNHLVASVLGPTIVAGIGLDDQNLLQGAFSSFTVRAAALIAAAQAARTRLVQRYVVQRGGDLGADIGGIYDERDSNNRRTAVAGLLTGLVALAVSKLYDPAPDAALPGQGEFDNMLVPASLIRETVNTAGGSVGGAFADLSQPQDFGGVGTGGTTYEMFGDNGIKAARFQWVYGPAIRSPFNSHEDLDGLDFDSWDDDSLAVADEDSWIGATHYHPGDHTGCLCAVAPILATDLES